MFPCMAAHGPRTRATPELSKPAPIRLRLDFLAKLAAERGAFSDVEIASVLGLDPSQYNRVRRLEIAPGVTFIARVLRAFPGWHFEELFVIDEPADEAAAVPA
jgi:hypothetical protein